MIGVECPEVQGRTVIILCNARAGTGQGPAQMAALQFELRRRGLNVQMHSRIDDFSQAVQDLYEQGELRAVVAAGGDGTAELVVNQIPQGVPMAVYPLGTENLLAKYLGWTTDPAETADALERAKVCRLDAGQLTSSDGASRLFLLMIGCGFDAEVIQRLHVQRDGPITHWSYAKPILDAVRTYRFPKLQITPFDLTASQPLATMAAHWAFVFNFPSYAVGLGICRDATPNDGLLDVITFPGRSTLQGLIHLGAIMVGLHRQQPGVQVLRTPRVTIHSDQYVPVQADGDPCGTLPVDVRVLPQRWTAIVPVKSEVLQSHAKSYE